jgi:WD40 repeat protein
MSSLIGNTIGPYLIVYNIKTTHTTALYRAFHQKLGRMVALQILLPDKRHPADLLSKIKQYSKVLGKLSHPNIGTLLDCEEYDGYICLAYDFNPKEVFHLRFNKPLSFSTSARLLLPIVQALAHAHEQGIIHGYLRPTNIVINDRGALVLYDFGLEILLTQEIEQTSPGIWLCSDYQSYVAPEQVRQKFVDQRVDIYAFGMLYYQLLHGERAFVGETPFAELINQYHHSRIFRSPKVKKLPKIHRNILLKMLSEKPQDRFQDMQHINSILTRLVLGQSISKTLVTKPNWKPKKVKLQYRYLGLFILLIPVFIYLLFPPSDPPLPSPEFPTITPSPTSTPTAIPTNTRVVSTATPIPTATPTARIIYQNLPAPFNQPIPTTSSRISVDNSRKLRIIKQLGIGTLYDIDYSEVNGHLALATSTGVFIFENDDPNSLYLYISADQVMSVAFSQDGSRLVAGKEDGGVYIWDSSSGDEASLLTNQDPAPVRRIIFSPNGSSFASVSDIRVQLWNLESRDPIVINEQNRHTKPITGAAFSPDGSIFATVGADNKLVLWDTSSGGFLDETTYTAVYDVAFLNNQLLFTSGKGAINSWPIEDGKIIKVPGSIKVSMSKPLPLIELEISTSQEYIAAGDEYGSVYIWEYEEERVPSLLNNSYELHEADAVNQLHSLKILNHSLRLISALGDNSIKIWSLRECLSDCGEVAFSNSLFGLFIEKMTVSPDGKYLAAQVGSQKKPWIAVWDIVQDRLSAVYPGILSTGRVFSFDSKYLAIRADTDTMKIYNLSSNDLAHAFQGHTDISSVSFSEDSSLFATWNQRDLRLWSMVSNQELNPYKNLGAATYRGCWITKSSVHSDVVIAFAGPLYVDFKNASTAYEHFCQKNLFTLSMNAEGTLAIDLIDFQLFDKDYLKDSEMIFEGQNSAAPAAISPDGNIFVSSPDGTIIWLWDANSGEKISNDLIGHHGEITKIVFTPDQNYMLSSGKDGVIFIWGVQGNGE